MWHLLRALTLIERISIGVLALAIAVSTFQIGDAFLDSHTTLVPASGGTYVEGVTGTFQFLNPVLAQTDLDRDASNLLFCGLTRFDPTTNTIIDDIATHTLSADQRTYTFTIKENVKWHDGEPVTADDAIYTFRDVIQHADFPNTALAADFRNITITKVDDRTITMNLPRRYAFFIYVTTVGLLPRHLLSDKPVAEMLSSDFNLSPVGCGPYKLENISSTQIRLTANPAYYKDRAHLDTIVFRIFQNEEQLFKNLDGVNGTKDLAAKHIESLRSDARLALHEFTLPQYVALFFNIEHAKLRDKKTRLGLQVATDKKAVIQAIGGKAKGIDTPLLEIANSDWQYDFSATRADGALFDAGWRYPTKAAEPSAVQPVVTKTPTVQPAATAPTTNVPKKNEYITVPTNEQRYATDKTEFLIQGTAPAGTSGIIVNGYPLKNFVSGKTWSYKAAANIGTLKAGENPYTVVATVNGVKQTIGTLTVLLENDAAKRTAWLDQNNAKPEVNEKTDNQKPEIADSKQRETANSVATNTVTPVKTGTQSPPERDPANGVGTTSNQPVKNEQSLIENRQSKIRTNIAGEPLALTLLVLSDNAEHMAAAAEIKKQWSERGVALTLDPLPRSEFLAKLQKGDYDIILSGQNLGYNLDAYAFWHSSEARENGTNLSNLSSPAVNAWLEQIRSSFNSTERRKRLGNLRDTLASEVPAVVLYTPTYTFAIDQKIQNFNLGRIALVRDRFANTANWHMRESRELKTDVNIWTFITWLFLEGFKIN